VSSLRFWGGVGGRGSVREAEGCELTLKSSRGESVFASENLSLCLLAMIVKDRG
jgi:hypothetical protein